MIIIWIFLAGMVYGVLEMVWNAVKRKKAEKKAMTTRRKTRQR